MSIVRLIWALVTATWAGTMLLCLVVTARAVSDELAPQLALQAQPVAEQLVQERAALAPGAAASVPAAAASAPVAGTPPATLALTDWQPPLGERARQAGWAQVALHDAEGRLLQQAQGAPSRGWTAWLHGGWPQAAAQAQVVGADGRHLGMLTITLSTDSAQHAVDRACAALALAFGATGAGLLLALRRLERWARRPLDAFCDQIAGLSERRFVSMTQPRIAEWVDLSKSLNVMVARVRQMLDERDEAVGSLKDKLAHDALTQTTSRDVFMAALKTHLRDNPAGGGLAIVRVDDLEGMNRRQGRQRTDEFLVALATTLRSRLLVGGDADTGLLARLNGADFGLLLPGCDLPGWQARLQAMAEALATLADDGLAESAQFAWMGGTTFLRGESVADVLVRADTMVMAAEAQQQPLCTTGPTERRQVKAVAQWRVLIETALDTGHFALRSYPVVDASGAVLHHEAMLRLLDAASGQTLDADDFVAPAIRCGRIADLDLKAIGLALTELGRTPDGVGEVAPGLPGAGQAAHAQPGAGVVAVNIAAQSALRPVFQRQLAALLAGQPALTARLRLEVRESPRATTTARALEQLCRTVAPYGCRVGIDHFGINLSALSLLQSRQVAYVKLAPTVVAAAVQPGPARAFISLLVELAARTGVQVLAGGVASPADATALAALGVQGFTGPGVAAGRDVVLPGPGLPGLDLPAVAAEAEAGEALAG